jgi:hypothetical protein
MKTAKEYWNEKFGEYPQNDTEKLAVAMMQEYAQEAVKNNAADVSGSSLPLKIERILAVVAQRWGNDYEGSTVGILGRGAIELCEQYGIDWKNYR